MTKKEAFEMFENFVKNNPSKFNFKYKPSELRAIELFFIQVRLKEGRSKNKSYKKIIEEVHDEYMREYNGKNGSEPVTAENIEEAVPEKAKK